MTSPDVMIFPIHMSCSRNNASSAQRDIDAFPPAWPKVCTLWFPNCGSRFPTEEGLRWGPTNVDISKAKRGNTGVKLRFMRGNRSWSLDRTRPTVWKPPFPDPWLGQRDRATCRHARTHIFKVVLSNRQLENLQKPHPVGCNSKKMNFLVLVCSVACVLACSNQSQGRKALGWRSLSTLAPNGFAKERMASMLLDVLSFDGERCCRHWTCPCLEVELCLGRNNQGKGALGAFSRKV